MGWADVITIDEVKDIQTFSDYARQTSGVPYPSKMILNTAKKEAELLFQQYPNLTWKSLCQIVLWSKAKRRRHEHVLALLRSYRWAYKDGFLPELDETEDTRLDDLIEKALAVESDPEWRRRLLESKGPARKRTYEAWAFRVDL